MSQHDDDDLFDCDDPLTMMGVAMVGMTLQEMAEQEARQRRARLTPSQRAAADKHAQEMQQKAWLVVATVLGIFFLLVCIVLPLLARLAGNSPG